MGYNKFCKNFYIFLLTTEKNKNIIHLERMFDTTKEEIHMAVDINNEERKKALEAAMLQIEKQKQKMYKK